jgi:hypothetical protein
MPVFCASNGAAEIAKRMAAAADVLDRASKLSIFDMAMGTRCEGFAFQ